MEASPQQLLITPLPHHVHPAGMEAGFAASCQWCAITVVQSRYNLAVWLQPFSTLLRLLYFPQIETEASQSSRSRISPRAENAKSCESIRFGAFSYWHSETNKKVTPRPPAVWPCFVSFSYFKQRLRIFVFTHRQDKHLNPSPRFLKKTKKKQNLNLQQLYIIYSRFIKKYIYRVNNC